MVARNAALADDHDILQRVLDGVAGMNGMTKIKLANELGLNPTSVYRLTTNLKREVIEQLALLSGLPFGLLNDLLTRSATSEDFSDLKDITDLKQETLNAHRLGHYERMRRLARLWQIRASREQNNADHALACNREASAWIYLGFPERAYRATTRGLSRADVPADVLSKLRNNRSCALLMSHKLTEALVWARDSRQHFESAEVVTDDACRSQAFVEYLLGRIHLELLLDRKDTASAVPAETHFKRGERLYSILADRLNDKNLGAYAATCRGGAACVGVFLGKRDTRSALEELEFDLPSDACAEYLVSAGHQTMMALRLCLQYCHGPDHDSLRLRLMSRARQIANRIEKGNQGSDRPLDDGELENGEQEGDGPSDDGEYLPDRGGGWIFREQIVRMELLPLLKSYLKDDTAFSLTSRQVRLILEVMRRYPSSFGPYGVKLLKFCAFETK